MGDNAREPKRKQGELRGMNDPAFTRVEENFRQLSADLRALAPVGKGFQPLLPRETGASMRIFAELVRAEAQFPGAPGHWAHHSRKSFHWLWR